MIGVGIDMTRVSRFQSCATLSRVADFVLHESEHAEFVSAKNKAYFLAGRFAVKEALYKASSGAVRYTDIACGHSDSGALLVSIFPKQIGSPLVSVSYEGDCVVALAYIV